jgi:hypothetical protein
MHNFIRTLLFILLPTVLAAQQLPAISTFGYDNIGKKITWYEDKSAALNLEEIESLDAAGKFQPGNQEIINFGQSKSAFWLKIKYVAQNSTPLNLIVDAPSIEYIDFYSVS